MKKKTIRTIIIDGTLSSYKCCPLYSPKTYAEYKRLLEDPNLTVTELIFKADSILEKVNSSLGL